MTAINSPTDLPAAIEQDRRFFGHPRGLIYLSLTETWERFSFFGMQALLILYMVDYLFVDGRIGNVWGMQGYRNLLEHVFGSMTTVALAAQVGSIYAAFIYFTPVFGGLIGDRALGQRKAVILGGVLMVIGHLLMAIEAAFLFALLFLVIGCGLIKGNVAAQVGYLYRREDSRRDGAYVIFNMGVNVGVTLAPLVCGALGEIYGWDYGFIAAAIGMGLGLVTYIAGRGYLPPDQIRQRVARDGTVKTEKLTRQEWKVVAGICAVLMIGSLYSAAYFQIYGVLILWMRDHVDRTVFGYTLPATSFLSLTGLSIITLSPLTLRLWQSQAKRGKEPGDLAKIGWGCTIGMGAYLMLALVTVSYDRVPAIWAALFIVLATLGYLWYWPLTLAITSKTAPPSVNSTMIGVVYMPLFIANNIVGPVGQLYDKMPPALFWLIQSGICAAGLALIVVFDRPLSRLLGLRRGW